MRKIWPGLVLLLVALAFGVWALPQLPERVITHWGPSGEANGWSSPVVAVFVIPGGMLLLAAVLVVAPRLDPRNANFVMHAGAYWVVTNAVLALLAAVQVLVIGVNLGWKIEMTRWVGGGIGLLLVVMGNLLSRVRPNWIFGIRTPWTLSSELAWRETHRYGGYSFVCGGAVIVLTALLLPRILVPVLIAGAILPSLFSVVWSYFAWKRDPHTGAAS